MSSKDFIALIIRLIIGFVYLSAGLSKLAPEHLGNLIGPVDLSMIIDSWTINVIMQITAIVQVIGGALILSQRFSLLGILIILPLSIGIFILTLFMGFGGTIFINLFLMGILLMALFYEKPHLNTKNWKLEYLLSSKSADLFPSSNLSISSLLLFIISILLSVAGGIHLNIISTLGIFLVTLNIFQFKNFIFLDWIILVLFYSVCFITLNGILLNKIIPGFFYTVFYLIAIGGGLFFLRIIWSYLRNKGLLQISRP